MEAIVKSKETKTAVKPHVAFVGMGWIGRARMESLLNFDLIQCEGIYDPYLENIEEDDFLCNYHQYDDFYDLINDETIDAIVIATPNALHAEQAKRALEAGKAVFCQKPLGRTAPEVHSLINVAATNDKLLGVDYSYRFTEGIQKINNLVKDEKLGKIFAVESAFHNAYGPDKAWFYDMKRSGGGCLLDLGCHLVDLSLYLLDFPEIDVLKTSRYHKGNLLNRQSDQVEDYCNASLRSDIGVDINIACSWNLCAGKEADIYFNIYGTEGAAIMRNVDGSFFDFETIFCQGTDHEIISSPPEDWGGKAILDWAKKLKKDTSFDPTAWQYLSSAEIIDGVYGR